MIVLPLAAPTLAYMVYMLTVERRRSLAGRGGAQPWWVEAPWLRLVAAGLVLMAAVLAGTAIFGGDERGSVYVPAHTVDGEVVPGTTVPPQR